ncbi:MAG: hypothetical protein EXX96DRAFT_579419 [Benjaminiella poitrasii]|nr:MAG: hypothetical protein EXX96DRAFT_579419 [Benjaminiella poitrasii]
MLHILYTIYLTIPKLIFPFLFVLILAKVPTTLLLSGIVYVYMMATIFNKPSQQEQPLLITSSDNDKQEKKPSAVVNKQTATITSSLCFSSQSQYTSVCHRSYDVPKQQAVFLEGDKTYIFTFPLYHPIFNTTSIVLPRLETHFNSPTTISLESINIITISPVVSNGIHRNTIDRGLKINLEKDQGFMVKSNSTETMSTLTGSDMYSKRQPIPASSFFHHFFRTRNASPDTNLPLTLSNFSLVPFSINLTCSSNPALPNMNSSCYNYPNYYYCHESKLSDYDLVPVGAPVTGLLSSLSSSETMVNMDLSEIAVQRKNLVRDEAKMRMIEALSVLPPSLRSSFDSSSLDDLFENKSTKSKIQKLIQRLRVIKKKTQPNEFKTYCFDDTNSSKCSSLYGNTNQKKKYHPNPVNHILKSKWKKLLNKT